MLGAHDGPGKRLCIHFNRLAERSAGFEQARCNHCLSNSEDLAMDLRELRVIYNVGYIGGRRRTVEGGPEAVAVRVGDLQVSCCECKICELLALHPGHFSPKRLEIRRRVKWCRGQRACLGMSVCTNLHVMVTFEMKPTSPIPIAPYQVRRKLHTQHVDDIGISAETSPSIQLLGDGLWLCPIYGRFS
ncbi:hypothetical protein VTK56DRAFT_7681 [Thermocarpiscus australiensis]